MQIFYRGFGEGRRCHTVDKVLSFRNEPFINRGCERRALTGGGGLESGEREG